jgi:hypothetical protein
VIGIDRKCATVGEHGGPEVFGLERGIADIRVELRIRSPAVSGPREQSLGLSESLEARIAFGSIECGSITRNRCLDLRDLRLLCDS